LGNCKTEKYCDKVADLVKFYTATGHYTSLKVDFLGYHIEFFPENLGAVFDKHIQQFHQDISTMAQWYQSKWSPSMLADDCWTLKTDNSQAKYS
jgi:hypothetical protein